MEFFRLCSLTHQVATWVDETLNIVAPKLEHPAQVFSEFQSDKIVSLHTCWLFTCARLESGSLYWWSVLYLLAEVSKVIPSISG